MNTTIIKNALSYDLGSDLHESWRKTRKKDDGTYEPRIKKSKDESWNISHGTNEVDIANCTFEKLPSNWQYENLEAARVAIDLVFDKVMSGEEITPKEEEIMASTIHDEWLKRNTWVFDQTNGNPKLAVSFDKLSKEEQEKDRVQLLSAISKSKDYLEGKINIEEICSKYNLPTSIKTKN